MKKVGDSSEIVILFLVLLFLFTDLQSFAQCDTKIKPSDNKQIAYKMRGDRCEGFYVAQVGAPSIQVVGLLKGKFRYNLEEDEVISVTSTLPDREINIRAVGIPMKTYYQLDAQINPTETFLWPVGDVLYENRLSSKSVKIFGWIGSDNEKTYVPVIVEPKKNTVTNDDRIRLYFRTSFNISQVIWRYSMLSNNNCEQYNEYTVIEESYKAGKAIPILLSDLTGNLCVEIKVRKENSNYWKSKRIYIIIDEG